MVLGTSSSRDWRVRRTESSSRSESDRPIGVRPDREGPPASRSLGLGLDSLRTPSPRGGVRWSEPTRPGVPPTSRELRARGVSFALERELRARRLSSAGIRRSRPGKGRKGDQMDPRPWRGRGQRPFVVDLSRTWSGILEGFPRDGVDSGGLGGFERLRIMSPVESRTGVSDEGRNSEYCYLRWSLRAGQRLDADLKRSLGGASGKRRPKKRRPLEATEATEALEATEGAEGIDVAPQEDEVDSPEESIDLLLSAWGYLRFTVLYHEGAWRLSEAEIGIPDDRGFGVGGLRRSCYPDDRLQRLWVEESPLVYDFEVGSRKEIQLLLNTRNSEHGGLSVLQERVDQCSLGISDPSGDPAGSRGGFRRGFREGIYELRDSPRGGEKVPWRPSRASRGIPEIPSCGEDPSRRRETPWDPPGGGPGRPSESLTLARTSQRGPEDPQRGPEEATMTVEEVGIDLCGSSSLAPSQCSLFHGGPGGASGRLPSTLCTPRNGCDDLYVLQTLVTSLMSQKGSVLRW